MRQHWRGRRSSRNFATSAPGIDSDEIHWKTSARRGRPVTRVFQRWSAQEIYVVVDCSRLSARESEGESRRWNAPAPRGPYDWDDHREA